MCILCCYQRKRKITLHVQCHPKVLHSGMWHSSSNDTCTCRLTAWEEFNYDLFTIRTVLYFVVLIMFIVIFQEFQFVNFFYIYNFNKSKIYSNICLFLPLSASIYNLWKEVFLYFYNSLVDLTKLLSRFKY